MKFIITSHGDGEIRLSRPGHWGGIPYHSADAAADAASAHAAPAIATIERETIRIARAKLKEI